jgi:hypothetical protein
MVSVENGGRALVPLPREAAGGVALTPAEVVRRAIGLALGAAGLALEIARAIVERSGPAGPEDMAAPTPGPPGLLLRLPGAALGLGLEAQRRSLPVTAALGARLSPLRAVPRPAVSVARTPLAAAWRRLDLDGWALRGLAEQRRNRQGAAEVAHALIGSVAAAVLDELDVDGVVARVDLDRIVDRLDLDRIAERIDGNAIAARIDLDAVIARVDIDAVVARVDLPGHTEQVIDGLDIGELIRESSGSMATETADALRLQGMRADRLLSRVVDHLLRRQRERQTGPLRPSTGMKGRRGGRLRPSWTTPVQPARCQDLVIRERGGEWSPVPFGGGSYEIRVKGA